MSLRGLEPTRLAKIVFGVRWSAHWSAEPRSWLLLKSFSPAPKGARFPAALISVQLIHINRAHKSSRPLPMSASQSPEARLTHLVEALISGFEELFTLVRGQVDNEKALRDRVEFAANEVSDQTVQPAQLLVIRMRYLLISSRSRATFA